MIPSQMLKGVLQGSVLAILGQRETYGYEIVQALHGYGFGSVSEGTIYPLLLRLEKERTAAVERLPGFGEEEMTCGSPL